MKRHLRKLVVFVACVLLALQSLVPGVVAFAAESGTPSDFGVKTSSEGDAAVIEGADFALSDFTRAQKGTNTAVEGKDGTETYYGYRYYVSSTEGSLVAIGMPDYVVVYVPVSVEKEFGLSVDDEADMRAVEHLLLGLDTQNASGGVPLNESETWLFTDKDEFEVDGVLFKFDQEIQAGRFYACVIGADGSDVTDASNPLFNKPTHADSARIVLSSEVAIAQEATGIAAAAKFLETLDWSPLWITLKTTGVAIVFIFVLGLAAAYFTLQISPTARSIFDSIFTIPMVLPPTVCGFVLLYLCGSRTAFGQFFIDIGFPLIFSWPATVIAAVVVAFPLMYRNARGAFENLDPNMLDAARTLGWSNQRIFFKLMLPLSWSSIAAATVLAFARALGEFGATLFLAGNYLGVTRTIPIAIYFEWMNGNETVAWFWVGVILVFSFVVILFINLWSKRTTKYRKREVK